MCSCRVSSIPKVVGRDMPAMPLGPKENSFQFSRMSRMISPKPRVTMAR